MVVDLKSGSVVTFVMKKKILLIILRIELKFRD